MLYGEALFCYSHQGGQKAAISYIKMFPSASPFVRWLLLCWSVDGLQFGHKAPQIKERENREEWGLPPSGDLLRRGGKKKEKQRGEKDSERLRHIILLSLIMTAGLSMHGCGRWGHALTAQPYLLSPLKDTVGLDSARFNQGWIGDFKLQHSLSIYRV